MSKEALETLKLDGEIPDLQPTPAEPAPEPIPLVPLEATGPLPVLPMDEAIPVPEGVTPPEEEKGKIVLSPGYLRWIVNFLDELAAFARYIEGLKDTEPSEHEGTLEMIQTRMDRLCLGISHRIVHNREELLGERPKVDPLVEIPLLNMQGWLREISRDLAMSPERPTSWEKCAKELGECVKKSKAAVEYLTQPGMSDAMIVGAEPLRTDEGERLVD